MADQFESKKASILYWYSHSSPVADGIGDLNTAGSDCVLGHVYGSLEWKNGLVLSIMVVRISSCTTGLVHIW